MCSPEPISMTRDGRAGIISGEALHRPWLLVHRSNQLATSAQLESEFVLPSIVP